MSILNGKTIHSTTRMCKPPYDDTGWLRLDFTDGTHAIIIAGYMGYTGQSEDEYPTTIGITTMELEPDLVPMTPEQLSAC